MINWFKAWLSDRALHRALASEPEHIKYCTCLVFDDPSGCAVHGEEN
jgi:hypothetical protein